MSTDGLPEVLADAEAIGVTLGIAAARIRQWASRGKVQRRGRSVEGRTLFSLDEVARVAGVVDE